MAYIGPYNSNAAKISMPELNEAGLLQISPAVTWPGLTKKIKGVAPDEPEKYRPAKPPRKTFCRVCTTDDLQGPLAADFAKEELKVKKVYILNDKELYGEGLAKMFRQQCEKIGIEVIGDEGINTTSIEFGGLMTKIKGLNPDLVYFGGTTQSKGGQIAKDMVGAGLACPMLAPDGCYEQAFIDSAGAANLNGRAYVSVVGLDPSQLTGKGAEFVKRYKEKYKNDPEAFALYGYECRQGGAGGHQGGREEGPRRDSREGSEHQEVHRRRGRRGRGLGLRRQRRHDAPAGHHQRRRGGQVRAEEDRHEMTLVLRLPFVAPVSRPV